MFDSSITNPKSEEATTGGVTEVVHAVNIDGRVYMLADAPFQMMNGLYQMVHGQPIPRGKYGYETEVQA